MKTRNGDAERRHSYRGQPKRLAVVGGGIVGLAHAWSAARRGWKVLLFERGRRAQGASIRNFGMVWPIGQPNGPDHRMALESRACWLELLSDSGIWYRDCGSLHLAYAHDELKVLAEFTHIVQPLGYECQLLTPGEVLRRSPAARRENLLGGLWSPTELCVDPREVVRVMPYWLSDRYAVDVHFGTTIEEVALPRIKATDGNRWTVDQAVIASGADLQTLYPNVFRNWDWHICKLQMLRTVPQPNGWKLGPMLAGGLTLRHYDTFNVCPSLKSLKERIACETPELDRYGIHVMAAQNGLGEVILGDSHEYDDDVTPFDKSCIDELILRELRQMIELPDWTIAQRWHGRYPKLPGKSQFVHQPERGVHIVIASGGCGMTMSFGLAERLWESWQPAAEWSEAAGSSIPALPCGEQR